MFTGSKDIISLAAERVALPTGKFKNWIRKNTMVKKVMKVAGIFVMVCLLMNSTAFGKTKKAKATEIKVTGIVTVTREAGKITSVTLTTADSTSYNVVLDSTGLKIGKTEANSKIEAKGIVSQKGDQKWIDVKKFSAVKEKHKKGK